MPTWKGKPTWDEKRIARDVTLELIKVDSKKYEEEMKKYWAIVGNTKSKSKQTT